MIPNRTASGLRGSVRSCTEESTFPPVSDPDGKLLDRHSEYTTEYNPDGRLTLSRIRNSDGSYWVTHYEYLPSGQMLKIASGTEGQVLTETHFSYDENGRLQEITTDGRYETPVSFRYDEHGRKSKIQVSRAEDYRPNMAHGGSPFEAADRAPTLPGGGSATTFYDEHDRPSEVQVRDAGGQLVSRAIRSYDAEGHVIQEKQILDNMVSMFPPETMVKIQADSGLTPDQLRQELGSQLKNFLGGQGETYSVSYRYDSGGHLVHTDRRIFNHEEEIDTNYNEHGDAISEITRRMQVPGSNSADPAPADSYSEAQYSYEYDQRGNWTIKTVSYRFSHDAAFQISTVSKRSLTYS